VKHVVVNLLVGISITLCFVFTLVAFRSDTGIDDWHFTHVTATGLDSHFVIHFTTRGIPGFASFEGRKLQYSELWIPYWLLILLSGVPGVLWVQSERKRKRLLGDGICVQCGYDMRATPGRCPECGAVPSVSVKIASPIETP
jgi:hypothetical protein